MPANSPEYQKQYRAKNKGRTKNATVGLSIEQHTEFKLEAEKRGMQLAPFLRLCTELQVRGSRLKSPEVAEELKELRFLLSNISNNVNQTARHSNRLKTVVDENEVFKRLKELDDLIVSFVESRLTEPT
jgi:hypothetical protein